jgi:hypothetical protein
MSQIVPLVLGGIAIWPAAGPIRQSYEPIGGSSVLRMSLGAAVKLTHWSRTRTSASGSGWLDPGLDALDYSQPLELLCVKPRAMDGTGTAFTLPSADQRRSDVQPWGLARVGDRWTETALVLAGDEAQLTAVAGATAYRVCWYPRYVVFTSGLVSEFDDNTGRYDWSLSAEQV